MRDQSYGIVCVSVLLIGELQRVQSGRQGGADEVPDRSLEEFADDGGQGRNS